jgi:hypothetical protein
VTEGLWQLWDTVTFLDLFDGIPDEYRKEAEKVMDRADFNNQVHTSGARLDRSAYQTEHPWGWLYFLARHHTAPLARNIGKALFVKPVKGLLGIKPVKPEGEPRYTLREKDGASTDVGAVPECLQVNERMARVGASRVP